MRADRRAWTLFAAVTVLAWAAAGAGAQELEPGLVTALDRIGGNLLGTAAFDAVLTNPPDPVLPQTLRLFASLEQPHPLEIVLVTATNPPEPVRAFFRMTVGGPEVLKLEYDPNAGDILPCYLPPADLSGIAQPPADGGNGSATFRAGLVTALGEVGKDLLGAGRFDAVLQDPPEPIQPQRLRIFVSRTSHVELVLNEPPEPVRPLLQMIVGGEEVELQLDSVIAGGRGLRIEQADLSGVSPPEPVR